MKSFGFIFLIICSLNAVTAQNSCLPQGIAFAHQYDIDAFQVNYPGCTHIEGSVSIFSDEVYNLLGLSAIQSIGGNLAIGNAVWWTHLSNLDGLQGLTYVGGVIGITNNPFLENIAGLSNVGNASSISVINNESLKSLAGLEKITNLEYDLRIEENHSLLSLNGLSNLTSINCNGFKCISNDLLADFSGLENLKKCMGILEIGINGSLENVDGIINLAEFFGGVAIYSNAALTNLDGIKNIPGNSIRYLSIINNESLTKCHVQSVCDRLAHGAGGSNTILNNGQGCIDYFEVKHKCESLGVTENDLKQGFKITASPEVDYIVIETENLSAIYTSALFDLQGRMLLNQNFKGPTKIINTGFLKAGVYILSIQEDNMVIARKVMIK